MVYLEQIDLLDMFFRGLYRLAKLLVRVDEAHRFLVCSRSYSFTRYGDGFVAHRQQVVNNGVVEVDVVEAD